MIESSELEVRKVSNKNQTQNIREPASTMGSGGRFVFTVAESTVLLSAGQDRSTS